MKTKFIFFQLFLCCAAYAQTDSGLVAKYEFTNNLKDETNHHFDGKIQGNYSHYSNDRFGNKTSAITLKENTKIVVGAFDTTIYEYTFCAWVRIPFFFFEPSSGILIQQGKSKNNLKHFGATGFSISSEQFRYQFQHANSKDSLIVISEKQDIDTNWHFLVGVFTGDSLFFYQDNVLQGKSACQSKAQNVDTLFIGYKYDPQYSITTFTGDIDEAIIYNRALNKEEIQQLYTKSLSLKYPTMQGHKLVRITDLLGRDTEANAGSVVIYHYSDGSRAKVFIQP